MSENEAMNLLNSNNLKEKSQIKIWLDKDSEFYNRSMKSLHDIEMCSTHCEGKPVAAERFIKNI